MVSPAENATFFKKAPACSSTEKVSIIQIKEELKSYSDQCTTIDPTNAGLCLTEHEKLRSHIDYYRCRLGISAKSLQHIRTLHFAFNWKTVQEAIEEKTAIQFQSGDMVYACDYSVGRFYPRTEDGLCYFNATTAAKSRLVEDETIVKIVYSDNEEALVALDEDGQAYVVSNLANNNRQFIPGRTKEPWHSEPFEQLTTFAGSVYAQFSEWPKEYWRKLEAGEWAVFNGKITIR